MFFLSRFIIIHCHPEAVTSFPQRFGNLRSVTTEINDNNSSNNHNNNKGNKNDNTIKCRQ